MSGHRGRGRHRSDTALPAAIRSAANALHAPVDSITPIGGQSGQSWSCGDHILRVGEPEQLRREVVAMRTASSVVPVPDVYEVAEFADADGRVRGALLLQRMPGRPAADGSHRSDSQMRSIGEACGRLHSRLAAATLTPGFPRVRVEGAAPRPSVLLHLDLHPLNVLVDEVGEVSGVIDWANAAGGPEELDRARTWSILTFDPAAAALRDSSSGAALIEGWSATAGWALLSTAAIAWACSYMLDDLADRPPSEGLQHAREQLEQKRLAARSQSPAHDRD